MHSFQVLRRGTVKVHIVQDAYLPFLCPASSGWELRGQKRSLRASITETVLKKLFFFFSSSTKATGEKPQTIYRKEYIPFPGHRPDQISRWYSKRRAEVRGLRAPHSAWPPPSAQETLNNQTLLGSILSWGHRRVLLIPPSHMWQEAADIIYPYSLGGADVHLISSRWYFLAGYPSTFFWAISLILPYPSDRRQAMDV